MTELGKPQKNFADTFSAVTAIKNEAYPEPVAEPVGYVRPDVIERLRTLPPAPAYVDVVITRNPTTHGTEPLYTIPQPSPPDRDAIRKGALEEAHKAVRIASEAPIHSGEMRYVAGHRLGVDRSLAAIRALASDPTPASQGERGPVVDSYDDLGFDPVLAPDHTPDGGTLTPGMPTLDDRAVTPRIYAAGSASSPKGTRE